MAIVLIYQGNEISKCICLSLPGIDPGIVLCEISLLYSFDFVSWNNTLGDSPVVLAFDLERYPDIAFSFNILMMLML